jgi:hypothetical protein
MILAMFLAHLVGDYILQWDALARWKSQALPGVLVHGAIVFSVTWLFSLPFDPGWYPWAFVIGLTHTLVDAIPLLIARRAPPHNGLYAFMRFLIDQTAHLSIIVIVLIASGYLAPHSLLRDLLTALHSDRLLAIALGYAFITMPAWILIEFTLYAVVNGSAPDFARATKYKYVGILERGLITTFVLLGQFALVPLVALPRLILDGPQVFGSQRALLYVAEWLGSLALAIIIGLGLQHL